MHARIVYDELDDDDDDDDDEVRSLLEMSMSPTMVTTSDSFS